MATKMVIIGAGFSGIAAGYANKKKHPLIIESKDEFGGLCGSFVINGCRFEYGPHFSFTNNSVVREVFDKTPYIIHNPYPYNYYKGIWIRHPVQNNCYPLDTIQKIRIIKSFIERKCDVKSPNDYDEWLRMQYGDYFTDEFSAKYTRKYWCKEPSDLSTNWIEKRMYLPTLDEVLQGAMEENTPNTYYAKEMRYPLRGGYREFIRPALDGLDIRYSRNVIKINSVDKTLILSNNETVHFDELISSIPLPEIVHLIDNVPSNVISASNRLLASSLCLVSIGFNKQVKIPSIWFYIYDEDIPFARVHSPSMKSSQNVPEGMSSLQFELYYTHEVPLLYLEADLKQIVINTLMKMHIADETDIVFIDIRTIKYANVIFYRGMEKDRKMVSDYLKEQNIQSIGRFGEWDYLWSDQSFLSGFKTRSNDD